MASNTAQCTTVHMRDSVSSMQFIPVDMLPQVNAYMVWKMLKQNSENNPNLQQITVTADMDMSFPELTTTHSILSHPLHLSVQQTLSTLSKEDLDAAGIAAETSPVVPSITEELTGVEVDVEPALEVTDQPAQQSTLNEEGQMLSLSPPVFLFLFYFIFRTPHSALLACSF